jgi:hypothetical protein
MAQRYYSQQWPIRSFTHPDQDPYTVSQRTDGGFECSCKVWIFNRKWLNQGTLIPKYERDFINYAPDGHCKHIQFVVENLLSERALRDMDTARSEGRKTIVVENSEFRAEVILDGRVKGLLDNL